MRDLAIAAIENGVEKITDGAVDQWQPMFSVEAAFALIEKDNAPTTAGSMGALTSLSRGRSACIRAVNCNSGRRRVLLEGVSPTTASLRALNSKMSRLRIFGPVAKDVPGTREGHARGRRGTTIDGAGTTLRGIIVATRYAR